MDRNLLKDLANSKALTLDALKTEKPELFAAVSTAIGQERKEVLLRNVGEIPASLRRALGGIDEKALAGDDAKNIIARAIENTDANVQEKEGLLARVKGLGAFEEKGKSKAGEGKIGESPLAFNPAISEALATGEVFAFADTLKIKPQIADALAKDITSLAELRDETLETLVASRVLKTDEAAQIGVKISLFHLTEGDASAAQALAEGPNGALNDVRDLLSVPSSDLAATLKRARITVPEGESFETLADGIQKRLSGAFPFEAMRAAAPKLDQSALGKAVETFAPILASNPDWLTKTGETIDLSRIDTSRHPEIVKNFEIVATTARRYPGLGLDAVFEKNPPQDAAKIAIERIGFIDTVLKQNPNTEFFALDYTPGSADLQNVKMQGLNLEEQAMVIASFKAQQRIFAITDDPKLTLNVLEQGYSSALAIAREDFDTFAARSKLAPEKARTIYERASGTLAGVSALVGSVIDVFKGGFTNFGVGNLFEDVSDGLKKMQGYADLFGPSEICDCDHCQSILSPAAYFVDLMLFTEQHVTDHVFTGAKASHALNLKVRRPDLWTLPLTCENTNTLLPTLVVVNEILERYLTKRFNPATNLADKEAVEAFIYGTRLPQAKASFKTPFVLASAKADAYLEAFELDRASLIDAAGPGAGSALTAREAAAFLKISKAEYDMLVTPNTGWPYLRELYGFDFAVAGGTANPLEVQEILPFTTLTREEFGDLVATKFVRADGARNVRIEAQKRSADSVQNDVERILGLNADALDAMHRFIRLWRLTPFSIKELDLVLKQLSPAAPAVLDEAAVFDVVSVMRLVRRFSLPVDEVCALWSLVPRVELVERRRSLFERLYNSRPYALTEGMLPKNAVSFVHPAFRPSATPLPEDNTLQRLLLATRLSEEELGALIQILAPALGANLNDANPDNRGFLLTHANLSLLYRHARLMKLMRRSPPALRQMLDFAAIPGGAVDSLTKLHLLFAFHDFVQESGLALDDIAWLTGGIPLAPEKYPIAADVAQSLIDAVTSENALLFADTVFAFVPGVTEDQSKALVLANMALFEPQGQSLLRLKAATPLAPALVIPPGVTATLASLQEVLARFHTGRILPLRLAGQFGLEATKLTALAALAGTDLAAPDLATALHGGARAPLEAAIGKLAKLALLFKAEAFTPARLAFLDARKALLGIADYNALTLVHLRTLKTCERLIAPKPALDPAPDAAAVEAALIGFTAAQKFAPVPAATLGAALGIAPAVATALASFAVMGNAPVEALAILAHLARLSRESGIGAETIQLLTSESTLDLDRGAEALVSALRQRFPDDKDFDARLEPLDNRLHGRKRDALADHTIRKSHERFTSMEDLYAYFLIDPQMQGCARTSRVVAAISSVQAYIHRILLNLEQDRREVNDPDHVHVLPSRVPEGEWSWRKNYRVWEANRKVFLWPENYLEPELRDDKTPLFKELEDKLLQQDINEQNVLDAYGDYLSGFEELANLHIAGAFHELSWMEGQDVLHVFGCTKADPPVYYYWTIDNLAYSKFDPDRPVSFSVRRKLDVAIPARTVTPIVHLGRLFLFWNEIQTSSKNKVKDGESKFAGYNHKVSTKFTSLRLDGAWTPPQNLRLREGGVLRSGQTIYDYLITKGNIYNDNVPVHQIGTDRHTEAQDGYTLDNFEWLQNFMAVYQGRLFMTDPGMRMLREADLFEQRQYGTPSSLDNTLEASWGTQRRVFHIGRDSGERKVYTPYANFNHGWLDVQTPAGMQALVADIDTFEDYLQGWGVWPDSFASYHSGFRITTGQRGTPIARVRKNAKALTIGGGPTGAGIILQKGPDAAYLFRAFGADAQYESIRLSTTLAREMSRILFTGGVNTLLDVKTQQGLGESDHILEPISIGRLQNRGKVGALDLRGAMGRYFREIFFEIPFLIADNLNSRQKFAAAQGWFHYLFNPTATLDPSINLAGLSTAQRKKVLRDRVWHYSAFKNLNPPKLRDILTDEAAIKAYKEDPFNPHAIARLRISAYQKSVVMKYVSNLLDWGDSLFAQFTMESVNEALVLYVMAQEILGKRAVKAGECGEGSIFPKTYANIKPSIGQGSEFLMEAESILWIGPKASKFSRVALKGGRSFIAYQRSESAVDFKRAAEKAVLYANTDRQDTAVTVRSARVQREETTEGRIILSEAMAYKREERDVVRMEVRDVPAMVETSRAAAVTETSATRFDRADLYQERVTENAVTVLNEAILSKQMDWKKTRPGNWSIEKGKIRPNWINDSIIINDFGRAGRFGWGIMRQIGPIFCIPENRDLKALWDRVEDRLYKIRHCLDITGARRDLSLFAPEIDPRLLVRARAQGLSIEDVLGASSGNLPPYRFAYLIEKARQYAGAVQGFGAQLLAAIEKRDMEELTRLRNTQALNMTKLNTRLREWELKIAEEGVTQIERQMAAAEFRRDYYNGLLDSDLNGWERAQQITKHGGLAFYTMGALFGGTAGVLSLIPQLGSPFAMKYGGHELNNSFKGWSKCFSDTAKLMDMVSASMGLEASFERRREGWEHQVKLAGHDIKNIEKQLSAARIRVDIATRAIELHKKNIEDQEEIIDFYAEKFSNLGLYNWMSSTLQRLYRQSFNSAFAMARLAERAYRFERGDETTPLLDASYWDASQAGLLAGERLMGDLMEMERRFVETNYRSFDIDQTFSLQQLDPAELLRLRETGECEIAIPELAFNLFYPGHYRRRIRAVRVTIPCITGPYTNVAATLTLKQSFLRKTPTMAAADLVEVPLRHVSSVATSTAQNDSGVFDFSFRDERYMPFEGAGAVSIWTLKFPKTFKPFDYATITDVLTHISYASMQDGVLRDQVEAENAALEGTITHALTNTPFVKVVNLRQDLSSTFQRLLNSPANTPLAFELDERALPIFLKGRDLNISRALLLLRTRDATGAGASFTLNGQAINAFAASPEFPGWRSANIAAALNTGLLAKHTLSLTAAGDLAAQAPHVGLDPDKLLDMALYVEMTL
jgi:hypothetical protein